MSCDHLRGLSTELGDDACSLVTKCLECGAVVESAPEQQSLPHVDAPAQQVPRRAQSSQRHEQKQDTSKPLNVLKLARQRLRDVKRELKALKKLELEKLELERLINAANGRPVAVVRDLRKRSG